MGKRSIIPAAPDVGSSPLKKYDFLEEDSDSPSAEQLGAVFADNDDTNEVRKKANELKPVFKPSVMKATSDGNYEKRYKKQAKTMESITRSEIQQKSLDHGIHAHENDEGKDSEAPLKSHWKPNSASSRTPPLDIDMTSLQPKRRKTTSCSKHQGDERETVSSPDYTSLLLEFFTVHNPRKIKNIRRLLVKYSGREEFMYSVLCSRYGVEKKITSDHEVAVVNGRRLAKIAQAEKEVPSTSSSSKHRGDARETVSSPDYRCYIRQ